MVYFEIGEGKTLEEEKAKKIAYIVLQTIKSELSDEERTFAAVKKIIQLAEILADFQDVKL